MLAQLISQVMCSRCYPHFTIQEAESQRQKVDVQGVSVINLFLYVNICFRYVKIPEELETQFLKVYG